MKILTPSNRIMNRGGSGQRGPTTQSNAPPCAILDDAELTSPATSFRGWRESVEALRAGHLFGSTQRSFPAAFQSFRSDKKKVEAVAPSGFPFRNHKGGAKGKDLSGGTPPRAWNRVVASSPPVAPPALTIRSVEQKEEEEPFLYGQCTPPAQEEPPVGYSPKTPPWWDASGNLVTGSA